MQTGAPRRFNRYKPTSHPAPPAPLEFML